MRKDIIYLTQLVPDGGIIAKGFHVMAYKRQSDDVLHIRHSFDDQEYNLQRHFHQTVNGGALLHRHV